LIAKKATINQQHDAATHQKHAQFEFFSVVPYAFDCISFHRSLSNNLFILNNDDLLLCRYPPGLELRSSYTDSRVS